MMDAPRIKVNWNAPECGSSDAPCRSICGVLCFATLFAALFLFLYSLDLRHSYNL